MAALAAVAAPGAVVTVDEPLDTRHARVGRAAAAKRDPRRPRPRRTPAEREPQRGGNTAFAGDGRGRVLQARLVRRDVVLDADLDWYPLAGYRSWSVGENLLWSSPGVDPARALDLWMGSPEHRANILNPRWREIGIGAVRTRTRAAPSASAGHDHHDRLRRSPLTADRYAGRRARSSVEERRPSKPLVGGSNPPGRIVLAALLALQVRTWVGSETRC